MYNPEKDGTEFADHFSRLVNNMGREARKTAIEKMLRDHPTLQQSMVRFFVDFMKELSKERGDLRNEGSRNFAQKIVEMDPYLPTI